MESGEISDESRVEEVKKPRGRPRRAEVKEEGKKSRRKKSEFSREREIPLEIIKEEDPEELDEMDFGQQPINHPPSLVLSHQSPYNLTRSDLSAARHLHTIMTRGLHATLASQALPQQLQPTSSST